MLEMRARYPSLKDKRVLVTGGGSGIGAAFVEAFHDQGCRVAFLDIAESPSRELAERLRPEPYFLNIDLRDLDALAEAVSSIETELGGIDVLINNAASDERHSPSEVTPAYWDDRMAVNLRHVFFATQAVVVGMRARGSGVILNLGSISWHLALPELALYETAKAGIEGMSRALARELGPSGIRVNTIIPGNIETPRQRQWYSPEGEREILSQQCLPARIQPADVATLALFLASDDARMCTGQNYWVDAGWR